MSFTIKALDFLARCISILFKAVSFLHHSPIISSLIQPSSKPPFAQLGTSDRNFSLISCLGSPSGTQMSTFRQDSNLPKWIAFFSLEDTPPKKNRSKNEHFQLPTVTKINKLSKNTVDNNFRKRLFGLKIAL